jgi:SDR family mycofactocin-dependent oxidoreductase
VSTFRVALVTGAARGIGAATVRRLAHEGYRVTALDWCLGDDGPTPYAQGNRAQLDALADEHDGRVTPVVADVRDRAAMDKAVAETVSDWGRLDAVVAAAAVMAGGPLLWETPAAELDLLWDVDVRGVWNCAAAAAPAMLAGPDPAGCRFVAVASAAGDRGLHRLAAYTTAKHAVVGLVRALAADLVGTGITAAVVSPGSTRTDMLEHTAGLYALTDTEEFAHSQLVRRLLEPDEIAATIAFCCSREGATVNGSVVHADGGFTG